MDPKTINLLTALAKVISSLGPGGIWSLFLAIPVITLLPMLLIALIHSKRQSDLLEAYRKDTHEVLQEYGRSVEKIGQYYKDNIILVKNYEKVTNDLHNVVLLNTQTMQRLCDKIDGAIK